jgi:hypothetical protein
MPIAITMRRLRVIIASLELYPGWFFEDRRVGPAVNYWLKIMSVELLRRGHQLSAGDRSLQRICFG